jgi:DNA-directed RNA polymerase II subunit RPB2
METLDAFRVHVDATSGLIAAASLKDQTVRSLHDDPKAEIAQVCVPYACKLLCQEWMSMCIVPRLRFSVRLETVE